MENPVKFLKDHQAIRNQEPQPILLCGVPGAGKSYILHKLMQAFTHSEHFLLVVMVEWNDTINKSKERFWKGIYHNLIQLSPQTVEKCGQEEVMKLLENYSSRFLFLWDLNLQDTRNQPPHMDRGTWVLSYKGLPEISTNCCVLKVSSLSQKQVCEVLSSIRSSDEHYDKVLQCYRKCQYQELIKTPDMVHIFNTVCLGMTNCVPFYKLIQLYIVMKIDQTEENKDELINLGQKAFNTIQYNRKYYSENNLVNISSKIFRPFLEHVPSRGYFFQYQVVEDYLAACYIVHDPKTACALWLRQAPLFKRVFEVVCALWCEEGVIRDNLGYVRKYLERLFDIAISKPNRAKKQEKKHPIYGDDGTFKKSENEEAMEVVDPNRQKQTNQAMKADGNKHSKKLENVEVMEVDEDEDVKQNNFVRWIFLSRIAKEHQHNQDILQLLAEMLTHKRTWLFKCKILSEMVIDNISLVLSHINLTNKLTIKLESGPNVTLLNKLWNMLCRHEGVCKETNLQLVIHHTDRNWFMNEKQLAKLPSVIAKTQAPLYITKYVGPLLCSSTPQFLKCLCMSRLEVLDVSVFDLPSLIEVLVHQQHSLVSVIVKINLKVEEQMIPDATELHLSSSLPLTLKIIYFENLQKLLDKFKPSDLLYSLKIYRVYIHKNFKLDLTRFRDMKSLFVRFVHMGKLPPITLETTECVEKMNVDNEDDANTSMVPLENWTFDFTWNLHLPPYLERFLMRNLSFCDDSNVHLLYKYWQGLPLQRLVLLDTNFSLAKFRSSFDNSIEDVRTAIKKFRFDEATESSKNVVKHKRLNETERKERRKHKPEGKELIVTSEAVLCKKCYHLSCTCACDYPAINNNRDNYQDFVSLTKEIYSSKLLNISYSGQGIVVRKDMCGDLQVECPLPFLDDAIARHPQDEPELGQVMEALALGQIICLSHTKLSHSGAIDLIEHLKKKKDSCGTLEPFRLTILSCYYHKCSKTKTEMKHDTFTNLIRKDSDLQQFNFRCDCCMRCHIFKKSIKGEIYFNNTLL